MTQRPWVIGPEHIPPITSRARARKAVDLTFLSALAHAKAPVAIDIARALWYALDSTHHPHADVYWDIVMNQLHTVIRRSLEMELRNWKPQSPWGKRIYAEGEAKGIAKGIAKGKAEGKAEAMAMAEAMANGVLALLRARRIRLTRDQREQIRSCREARCLQTWLNRAATASTAAELFEPRRRAS